MKLFLDKDNCIIAVNSTERTDLCMIEVDENDELFYFKGFSNILICCHKIKYEVEVISEERDSEGNIISQEVKYHITGKTPYVPTHLIAAIQQLENENNKTNANLDYIAMMTDVEL